MQKAKKIALILGVIGLILSFTLFFVKDESSFMLGLTTIFVLLMLVATTILFLYYYIKDFSIHPEYKREAKTMSIYFFGALILGVIMAFITGGSDPIMRGDGTLYDNSGSLIFIGTIIWTSIIMLIVAFIYSLVPLFSKK